MERILIDFFMKIHHKSAHYDEKIKNSTMIFFNEKKTSKNYFKRIEL